MKYLIIILMAVSLAACAPLMKDMAKGVSTYDYTHNADGSTTAHVESVNEISNMSMKINRETGYLEIEIGEMTKRDNVQTVVKGFETVTGNMAKVIIPFLPVK